VLKIKVNKYTKSRVGTIVAGTKKVLKQSGVVHDIKSVVYTPTVHFHDMHSRDTTVLIDLMSCTTPDCFSTFFNLATIVPTLLENS